MWCFRCRTSRHSTLYHTHVKDRSPAWVELCAEALVYRGFRCWICNLYDPSGRSFDVHHVTYARLGHEDLEDLQLVCHDDCHAIADQRRVWDRRREANLRAERTLWDDTAA